MRPCRVASSEWRIRAWVFAAAAMLNCLAGCSLISLKSPERPLSARDLNARILTREFSTHFIAAIEQSADDITASESDSKVLVNTLRWKIAAVVESDRAAAQIAPMMGLLDTWAFAAQMKAFVSEGNAGGALFGTHQKMVRAVADELADGAEALAKRFIAANDFDRYRKFVDAYTRDYPLENLKFVRAPILELWSRESGVDVKLVDSLGTIPEALTAVADRLQMYGDTLPSQAMWRTELALRESGYGGIDVRSALEQLGSRLDRMATAADTAPELVHGAVADVRQSVLLMLDRLDASSATTIKALRDERAALSATVRTEREAVVDAVDAQRRAIAQDATRITDEVVKTAGQQVRQLVREMVLLFVLMAVVMLGLPFAAGYFVGRARRDRAAAPDR